MRPKLTLDIQPGADIGRAAKQAQEFSDRLVADIHFDFNGVRCIAVPGGSSAKLAQRQQEKQGEKPTVISDE